MKLQVLGPGCTKCKNLKKNVETAVQNLGIDCEVEAVSDLNAILEFNVMLTPALVIDGEVKVVGKVPDVKQIEALLDSSGSLPG